MGNQGAMAVHIVYVCDVQRPRMKYVVYPEKVKFSMYFTWIKVLFKLFDHLVLRISTYFAHDCQGFI